MSTKSVTFVVVLIAMAVFFVHEYYPQLAIRASDSLPSGVKNVIMHTHNYIIHLFSKSLNSDSSTPGQERVYTGEELSLYNGEKGSPGLYLAILGKVYDVQRGKKHYGPGGSYHAFAGCDASRAFVTGDFSSEGLTDDVLGLSLDELQSIDGWAKFYHTDYTFKGKLVGRYYDSNGDRTDYHRNVADLLKQAGKKSKAKDAEKIKYPPCNVEWTLETGSKVWCSTRSGGIERNWVGVPRKLYEPGSDSYRCACIKPTADVKNSNKQQRRKGNLEEYEDCPTDSATCFIKD